LNAIKRRELEGGGWEFVIRYTHLSLDFKNLETPIQAFHRKKPPKQATDPVETGAK